ncbi:MAG: DUF45 domain-containing protein, partial [Proteobacteria bacterium]|nr:DUF45 domain-containing protein [Pseudomonadota bacterium]
MSNRCKVATWPPPHSIRRSSRARYPFLKVSPEKGLEIVLPLRCQLSIANELLVEKRAWIEKNISILKTNLEKRQGKPQLPTEIFLACIAEQWKIHYVFTPFKTQLICTGIQELTLLGNIDNLEACLAVLKNWIRQKAEKILCILLHQVSQDCGLSFTGLTIRSQQTRWGSCNSKKRISLNEQLIFFPL